MRNIALPFILVAALCAGIAFQQEVTASDSKNLALGESQLVIYPYGLMESVRNTDLVVPMQVQLYNPGDHAVELESLTLQTIEGQVLTVVDLDELLAGDSGFVADLYLALEMVDPDISHRHTKRQYIPLDEWQPLSPEAEGRTISAIIENVRELQESGSPQISNIRFELDLNALFGANSQPGDVVPVQIVAQWNGGAQSHERRARKTSTSQAAASAGKLPRCHRNIQPEAASCSRS